MLQRGDQVPHFDVTTIDGQRFSYSAAWQQKMLLLVALPALESESSRKYLSALAASRRLFEDDTACVVTRDRVPHVASCAVVIADRWGEIAFAVEKDDAAELPPPRELGEWLDFLRNRCPECEGEAR